jgi:Icc-related predicted phosphoesterase
MILLVIADDDEVRHQITPKTADVLVSCGDVADPTILQIAKAVQCSCIYAVKGNHDSSGAFQPPIVDLHLVVHEQSGLRFGGFKGSWKYKPRGNYLYEQPEARSLLTGFPAVDVFVSHNSPRHVHDREDEVHLGFDACVEYIQRVQPRLFLHGHQHVNQETLVGTTKVIGVYGHRWIEL